jgi:ElaB/YqjD/DUF883 family membrane-anchored ribosome-binding protein
MWSTANTVLLTGEGEAMTVETYTATPAEESAEMRQEMSETRANLAEKLGLIEDRVVDMVQGATNSVAHTIESMKESVTHTVEAVEDAVQGTVKSMKHALDFRDHVRQHPWLALGAAVVIGVACERFFSRL